MSLHPSLMGFHSSQTPFTTSQPTSSNPKSGGPSAPGEGQHHCLWENCDRVAADPELLYIHLCNDHIGRKSTQNLCLTCKWKGCEISCAKRDHITSHLRVHTPLKPHGCPVCSKTFKRPQDLKKHERIHLSSHSVEHKHSKAIVTDDPKFTERVLAGALAEKKAASLLVPRGRNGRNSVSSSTGSQISDREGSTPGFASSQSNSLSPHSFSDPLATPPPDQFVSYPQLSSSQGSNDFNHSFQSSYALQNNMYTLAGNGGYPHQPHLHHPQMNQYPGQQSWDGGAQTGQKRGYDLGGFFDEVKKRKVEPLYDQDMARRLEEMTRGLASVGAGGTSPGDGNPSPVPTHFNPLPTASYPQLPNQSTNPLNPAAFDFGQPNFLDQFSSAPLPDFNNEHDVANTNSFLMNLLMGATAQQQNLRGPPPSFNRSEEPQQQQQQQSSAAAPLFNTDMISQMGLAGMPGLDPVLFGSLQFQQQFLLQQQQQKQIRDLQDQLALQHRLAQQGSGVGFGNNGLYPDLFNPLTLNNQSQAQQNASRRISAPAPGSSSLNRPIAQLPSGSGRSSTLASISSAPPPNLGMQTLFTGDSLPLSTPVSAGPSLDASASSPTHSHTSSSHYSSSSSEIFSFNDDHDSSSSQYGRNASYPSQPSPRFTTSFDSLAKSRGPTLQTGLAPVNLLTNTYRMMESLSSAVPRESNERGSGEGDDEDEDKEDEAHSPSDVAMKGIHRSSSGSSGPQPSSPPLPSTLMSAASQQDFDPELKLPSIHPTYTTSRFRRASSSHSHSPTPSSPSSTHSHETTRPTTPTNHSTTLPPISALYPDLARVSWSADELVNGVRGISGLGGAVEREAKAKEAERHVELIKALLIAVNDKWRKTVASNASPTVKVEVKLEEAEMLRVGGHGLTA